MKLYSFDIKRGLEQEDAWLWKWCCSCSNSPVPLYELFWMHLYKLIGFPETSVSLMDIPNICACMCCAQGEHLTVLPRPLVVEAGIERRGLSK